MTKRLSLTIDETALVLRTKTPAVRTAVAEGAIASTRVGKLIRVPRLPLERLLGIAPGSPESDAIDAMLDAAQGRAA